MEEQKNRTLSLLASTKLALLGAIIFIAPFMFVWYFSDLLNYGLLVVWFVIMALLILILIMPMAAYHRTAKVKDMLVVSGLQGIFILIMFIIVRSILLSMLIG